MLVEHEKKPDSLSSTLDELASEREKIKKKAPGDAQERTIEKKSAAAAKPLIKASSLHKTGRPVGGKKRKALVYAARSTHSEGLE